jgi:Tol biopolymer transport system component/predicted Ser/Thr protein kinase
VTLTPGTRLGPYEVLGFVGAGGMGEVYRGRDTRLGRTVAIKIVASTVVHRPEFRRRFEEEARLAAQLDHPRIGAVYDVGEAGDIAYFVMEFIEGPSLAQRLAAGPMPFGELIGVAIEIAAGLAYAHCRGVVHRDLKPGNVLLTSKGVKVIDFGIGTLHGGAAPADDLAKAETVVLPNTDMHLVPGTAGFVPPERLQGLSSDHRADVFAFGALLYEMASGRRAFDGRSPADVIAAILTGEPPPLTVTSPEMADIDWVVRRALKKAPDDRWQSMADVEAVLRRIARDRLQPATPTPAARAADRRGWYAAAIAAAIAIALAAAFLWRATRAVASPPLVALTIAPPAGSGFTPTEGSVQAPQFAVSPDGRLLAFVAADGGGVQAIWIRPLGSTEARAIPGTARATYPFWAPTSRSIGFFADGALQRIDLDGAPPRKLAPALNGRGGTWNADNTILFVADIADPIQRITADGSVVPQTALSAERHETSHRFPVFLPDGRHFIYFARGVNDEGTIHFASIEGGEDHVIVVSPRAATYAAGHLLYVEDDALLAAPLDAALGRLTGDPIAVVDHIATSSNFYGGFSASEAGVLVTASKAANVELTWMSRDGRRLGTIAHGPFVDFRLSPDLRYLAVAEVEPRSGRSDLRLLDVVRGGDVRLTTSPATDASPVFSPDGARIVFRSNRERVHDLYLHPAGGAGQDALFLKTPLAKYPTSWSPDGSLIVYHAKDARTNYDIWAAPVDRPQDARPLVQTEFDEMQGQVSPHGRWLAYVSDESSRYEVYVQPLHGPGRRFQISTGGGSDPKWRADEREIFYISADGQLMSVALGDHDLDRGTPQPLFALHDVAAQPPFPSVFDVQPDGQRFLLREPTERVQTLPLTVLVNWSPQRRVPPASR